LIGLRVFEGDEDLGVLAAIMETGANDVYIIDQANGQELLIPAIPEVILKIDLHQKRMNVRLLEGLRG
jgi:16S rRNA processing protein RimM